MLQCVILHFIPYYRFVALNKHHTYFLLVDNGTVGKYGPELILRRKLENYISKQRIETRKCHTMFIYTGVLEKITTEKMYS